ncbi:MAG: hypothetical protein NVSMB38_05360 [Ktedonobacteraceae bacterium]
MPDTLAQDALIAKALVQGEDLRVSHKRTSLLLALIETSLIIIGLIAIGTLLPHFFIGDGTIRFQSLSELIQQHKWSDMPYSFVGPLFSLPFWLVGRHFKNSEGWCEQYNLFIFASGLLITYLLLKKRVNHSLLRKFFLILIAASMFANHIPTYYGEVFTAIFVGVGTIAAATNRTSLGRFNGWLAIILGVVNIPASLVGIGLVILKQMFDNKRLRYILVVLIAAIFIMTEAWLRRGGPFVSGYESAQGAPTAMPFTGKPGFSYPFWFGLLSILFSFGKGLLFFAPGLLLPVRKTLHMLKQEWKIDLYNVYLLWLFFLIGLILVYSRWWSWYGGWFWGPRFFLFASIPASFALAVRLHKRDVSLLVNLLTAGVLCLSAWVGIDGAIFNQVQLSQVCQGNTYQLEMLCHYTPDFSALWHPFIVPQHFTQPQILYMTYCSIVFLYLALPLFTKIGGQVVELATKVGREHLNVRLWKV